MDLIEDYYLDMKITQKPMREEMQSIERELQIWKKMFAKCLRKRNKMTEKILNLFSVVSI